MCAVSILYLETVSVVSILKTETELAELNVAETIDAAYILFDKFIKNYLIDRTAEMITETEYLFSALGTETEKCSL